MANNLSGLIIPMKVLAYRVKEDVDSVLSLNPDYKNAANNRLVNEPGIFNQDIPLQKGIHLHFILPSIMKHGLEKKDTNGNKTIQYPFVPDKYIVTRMYVNSEGKIIHDCNIVESAFYSMDGDGVTIPFWEKDISSNKNVRSFRHLGRQYSGIVQNDYTGPSAPSSGEGYMSELSGVGPGDPMFNAYYPSCRSVFGYYDNLENVPNNAVLTYSVIGYYSKAEQDLFYGIGTIEDMKKKLQDLNLSVAEENCKVCNSCLLFGEVCNIDLSKQINHSQPNCVQDNANICLGIGKNSAETLASIISHKHSIKSSNKNENTQTDIEHLLTKILYDIADEDSQIDGNFNIDNTIHSQGFISIDPIEKNYDIIIPKDIELKNPKKLLDAYTDFCKNQYELGKDRRLLEFKKNTLYYFWETCVKNPESSIISKELINQKITEINNLRSKLKKYKAIDTLLENTLLESVKNEKIEIKEISAKPFYYPKDPALMLFGDGIKRNFIFNNEENTENGKTLSCLTAPISNDEEINNITNQLLNEKIFINEIQENNRNDYKNFCAMTIKLMYDAQKDEGSKEYSSIMLNKNPYDEIVLFMRWSSIFYNDYENCDYMSNSFLEYDNTDYKYKGIISKNNEIICSGISVLTPHGVYNFIDKLKKYINNHSDNPDCIAIKEIVEKMHEIPAISQNLGGFTINLSCLQNTILMPMNDKILMPMNDKIKSDDVIEKMTEVVYDCLYNKMDNPFYEPDPERRSVKNSLVIPLREGALDFKELSVVSTFGNIQPIISNDEYYYETIYCSENMSSKNLCTNEEISGKEFCFLPLTLTTPARLTSYFVSEADNTIRSNSLPETTPIRAIIMPDMLNQNLDIFNNKGELIGVLKTKYITKDVGGKESKIATCTFMESPNYEKIKRNSTIDSFISLLKNEKSCNNESSYFAELMDVIKQKLDNTIPMDQSDLIFGRALVLTEMNIELEYFGGTEFSKKNNLITLQNDKGLSKCNFPVMIGDINRVTDGVICGFYGGNNGFDKGFSAFGYEKKNNQFLNASHPLVNAETTAKVTLLLDPSLKVTLSTGILPIEQLQINACHKDFSKMNLKLAEMNTLISNENTIFLPDITKGEKITRTYPQKEGDKINYDSLEIINATSATGITDKTIITDGFILKESKQKEN